MDLGGARARRARSTRAVVVGAALLAALVLTGCASGPVAAAPASHRPTPHRSATPRPPRPTPTVTPTLTPVPTVPPAPPFVAFDKTARSVDDPASPWVVVNKPRALNPISFVPQDLTYPDVAYVNHQPMRQETAAALVAMFQAGKAEAGLEFSVQSAYRSFESQTRVYDDDVAHNGQAYADTDTARPGHSEHQTGLAVDISALPAKCSLDACFGETPQGRWLAANAWRFGFILRYPADKVAVTGFTYEPWHFRYVGTPLATQLHATGVTTLEEFFNVPGGTSYLG
ncbi:M15 family metallopeptidase [Leifsonia shinshuensis]|uniref:M15 family metallopeptidase n=1 Tax=Leifsonia shinshuensis TaxID=150026 RepID=UPI0028640412|nr:M15 family metallopeptidase [Leifsonia shinshuensis]MDR6972083.1 D-alanyl-D-alanine carboxypeptidase [Leifsonia shinshuensis]